MTTSHFLSRSTYALALIVVVTIVFGLHACARTDSDSTASEPLSIAMLNEREICFNSVDGDIFTYDIRRQERTSLIISPNDREHDVACSADGGKILFARAKGESSPSHIVMFDLKTRTEFAIPFEDGKTYRFPKFDSSCSKIVFAKGSHHRRYSFGGVVWENWDLFEFDLTEKQEKRLTTEHFNEIDSISANSSILFTAAQSKALGYRLYRITDSGCKEIHIPGSETNSNAIAWNCDYSEQLQSIAFVSDNEKPFRYSLNIAAINGDFIIQEQKAIDCPSVATQSPRWSIGDRNALFFLGETGFGTRGLPVFAVWRFDLVSGLSQIVMSPEQFEPP